MKKKYRLLKEVDFRDLLRKGNKIFSAHFVCYWKINISNSNVRIGIIIPKKKCKLACNRKYLKRLFWSFNTREELGRFPNVRCVFFFKDYFYDKFKNDEIIYEFVKNEYLKMMRSIARKIA